MFAFKMAFEVVGGTFRFPPESIRIAYQPDEQLTISKSEFK
jgi:hypothetical protein